MIASSYDEFRMEQSIEPDGVVRLALCGELDLAVIERLRNRLEQLRVARAPVRLDLSQLEFMDSSGLGVILDALSQAQREGWTLELGRELTPPVDRLFQLTQVAPFIWGASA